MVTKGQVGALTAVGAVAFSVGGTLGYLLGKRKPIEVVEKITISKEDLPSFKMEQPPQFAILNPEAIIRIEPLEEAAPEEAVVNLLAAPDGDWDYESELSTRNGDIPYIIHKDEFFNDEMKFKQSTVTYYRGDNMLCDELDKLIYNFQHYIGHNLAFGHGSGDPNVFYVRNEHERMEWEVLLDEGSYEVVVKGLEIEHDYEEQDLKHSVRKFVMD